MPEAENVDNQVSGAQKQATPVSSADKTRISPASPETPDTSKYDAFPLTGEVIGDVLLETGRSRGGMSVVYEGTHLQTKKKVILKILRPEHMLTPEKIDGKEVPFEEREMVERFLDDAKTRKALNHPNIVKNISFGIHDVVNISNKDEKKRIPFIADELIPGAEDLTKVSLKLEQGAYVISQVAEALKYMHGQPSPIIHRDIKPGNIIVDKTLHAYLIDFGAQKTLAKKAQVNKPRLSMTAHGQVMGTLDYLAPEQAKSAKDVVPESDLYSLACTMYGIHSKRAPKERRSTNQSEEVQLSSSVENRMNLQVTYDIWLNDAIELKRQELTEKVKKADDEHKRKYSERLLASVVPVSWQYERLVMMVLEAKDPKDRPSLKVWSDKLDNLINQKLLAQRELTAAEKETLAALEEKVELFRKSPDMVKDDVKNKYKYAETLELLVDWTDDGEKRAVFAKEAYDTYNAVHVGSRLEDLKIDLKTLEERMQWLKSCQHYEDALKRRSETQQVQKEFPELVMSTRKALLENNYTDASNTYNKINPAKLPDDLRIEFDKLTDELVKAVHKELSAGSKEEPEEATKRYNRAKLLSDVLLVPEIKKEVDSFYGHHIQEREFIRLNAEYDAAAKKKDYFTMLEKVAGMEKCIDSLPEERKPVVRATIEGYQNDLKIRKDDVGFLRGLIESTDGLQAEFSKEVTDAGIPAERIKYYRDSIDDKMKKLQSINAENVGQKYDDFKAYAGFFQEDVRVQELKRGVATGTFGDRMSSLTELINIYHNRNDAGNEKLYILVQKKQLEARIGDLDTK